MSHDYGYIPQLLELHISQATGVDIIDLLHGSNGVFLDSWEPAENEDKGGGVFEDSPMHEGQNLIHSVIGNADEGFNLTIRGYDAGYCWQIFNQIKFALEGARAYSKRNRDSRPVYLALQVPGNSDIQYAMLTTGNIRALGQPFRSQSPYHHFMSALPVSMAVNREAWQDVPPGESTAIARGQANTFDDVVYGDATFAGVKDYSDTRKVFITNKRQQNNITRQYAHNDTGGIWTAIGGSLPYTLDFDNKADNAVYFGIEDFTDFGPFDSLVFDIGTGASATTSYSVDFEYWDGSAWGSLPNLFDNTSQLSLTGVNGVFWDKPSDWTAANLLTIFGGSAPNINGYWMRIRLSALTGTFTSPTQQNRRIYTAVNPFVEVLADDVGEAGLPLLLRQRIYKNHFEPGGLTPPEEPTLICGLRSGDDDNFTAYINLADRQNPTGLTVAAGTHSAFATSNTAPSGRAILYTPTGALDTWATRATVSFDNDLAVSYAGRYHAYLRCTPSGSGTTFTFRVNLKEKVTGSLLSTSPEVNTTLSSSFIPIDLGSLNLTSLSSGDNAMSFTLEIQIKVSSNTRTLTLVDLIVIPTSEWVGAFEVLADGGSDIYYDIDSTRDLRDKGVWARSRDASNGDAIIGMIVPSTNGRMILQPGKRNRLWYFFFDRNLSTSQPGLNFSPILSVVRRWRGVRA